MYERIERIRDMRGVVVVGKVGLIGEFVLSGNKFEKFYHISQN